MKPRILLDLDCVLVDFIGGAARLWGKTTEDLIPHWPAGHYGLEYVLAQTLGWHRRSGVNTVSFSGMMWEKLGNEIGFWANLKPLPWAKELFELVTLTTDDWWIVTSPSRCPRCIPEKREWLDKFLGLKGRWFDRMIPTGDKHLLANPRTILIDDYDANFDAFLSEGGHAILFPAWHNRFYAKSINPMDVVRPSLERHLKRLGAK